MQRFARLFEALDTTTRTSEKEAALERYFREAPAEDACWALALLTGRRPKRAISHTQMRAWAAEASGLPAWLIDECYESVGDLSETVSLLVPGDGSADAPPLHTLVETRLLPLASMDEASRRASIMETWRLLSPRERFLFHKLISGSFRVGAQRRLVVRALATIAGVEPSIMDHRLLGPWKPTPQDYVKLLSGEDARDPARPYPFFLASPLDEPSKLGGGPADWQIEWKWDGIRAQLIRRGGSPGVALLWTRGEELATASFPELESLARTLEAGTVLDGEVLAWDRGAPLPFFMLQRRLNRKMVEPVLFPDVPVVFMAYDLLERGGDDLRDRPLRERRATLEAVVREANDPLLRLSPTIEAHDWAHVEEARGRAISMGAEGLMIKRLSSVYGVGRTRGDWWKWKVDPFTIDAVLTHAQRGSGRRAGLLTDYTFALWHEGALVTIAKAYSGLTDEEIAEVDAHLQRTTIEKRGPVRVVTPELVFELAFEGVQESARHKAGLALRFPRMNRWRRDKKPADADALETLRAMLRR